MMRTKQILEVLREHGFHAGRLITLSKSAYRKRFPKHFIIFNAKIFTRRGLVLRGVDLDLTLDAKKLTAAARAIGEDLYVLRENDPHAFWEPGSMPMSRVLSYAAWKTPVLPKDKDSVAPARRRATEGARRHLRESLRKLRDRHLSRGGGAVAGSGNMNKKLLNDMKCVHCKNTNLVPSEENMVQVIPGQPDDAKRISINSPHFVCPKCGFQALAGSQGDELRRRCNVAAYGRYQTLVRHGRYLPPIVDYLNSNNTEPFLFRFVGAGPKMPKKLTDRVLRMLDRSAKNLKRGKASPPINVELSKQGETLRRKQNRRDIRADQPAHSRATDPRVEAAYARGRIVGKKMLAAEGGSISAKQAAERLGIPQATLLRRYRNGRVLGWTEPGKAAVHFPVWQFKGGELLPGLPDVLSGLANGCADLDDMGRIGFFLCQSGFLGRRRPLASSGEGRSVTRCLRRKLIRSREDVLAIK